MSKNAAIKFLVKYEAQATAIISKYTDYKLGKNQPPKKVPVRGASVSVCLSSFDTKATTKNNTVRASGRAMTESAVTATGATEALLNIDKILLAESKRISGYKPSRVTIFIPETITKVGEAAPIQAPEDAPGPGGTGAADDTTQEPLSRVTGLKYRRRLGNSFTYPFGAGASPQHTEEGMMNVIYNKLATGGKSLSFKCEIPPKPTFK
jgi:hypothetical protein